MEAPNELHIDGHKFRRSSAHVNGVSKPSADAIKARLKAQGLHVRVVCYGRLYYVYSRRP